MITVTFVEIIFFMIVILLISGLQGLNSFLNSCTVDICLGLNVTLFLCFAIMLFTESVRDVIEWVYEKHSWKCYFVNILAILAAGYMYFNYVYPLEGVTELAGTVFLIIFYAIYFLVLGIFYLIEDATGVDTVSHTNILTGIFAAIIILFFTIISMWNVGYTITKATVVNDSNIAYYIIPDRGVNIYESTEGRNGFFGYRVTSKSIMSSKDMTVYPAYVSNQYTTKGDKSYTAIYYNSDKLGFVEADELVPYYNDATTPELIQKENDISNKYYPKIPQFVLKLCIDLYHSNTLGSIHIST